GAFAGQTRSMSISSVNTTQLGLASGGTAVNLSLIDVTTAAGATDAGMGFAGCLEGLTISGEPC
ncbi:hypothetical protein MUP00_05635, partial [Candidatus Bathyarchaeota archaeon]|nr:hypothetical protein [Candidatus Bathyarchaeota archaeon]